MSGGIGAPWPMRTGTIALPRSVRDRASTAEVARLQWENERLRMERDILMSAVARWRLLRACSVNRWDHAGRACWTSEYLASHSTPYPSARSGFSRLKRGLLITRSSRANWWLGHSSLWSEPTKTSGSNSPSDRILHHRKIFFPHRISTTPHLQVCLDLVFSEW